ncbi:hypothetical protein SAMN05660691_00466 [Rheinheimera pacifica]|uniref:Uncharacterized protein n=1 Tax=Rheinheimera pacifica TaxID=173990 RepID=A0A1H6JL57_9GAMM|nr:hypothetical protein [Rheinheimera pacifica]SEH60475.1 hypothetical protein SAMN05660691_00466 [Rheinheimera pacifica]
MLPAKLYETLPYAYIAVGSAILLGINSWLAVVSGLLMVFAGAVIWVLRSDNRRSDIKGARNKYGGVLPFWFYEMLPFSYCIVAMLLFTGSDNMYFYPSAMIMLVVGMQLWLLRSSYRKHQRPVPVKTRPLRLRG